MVTQDTEIVHCGGGGQLERERGMEEGTKEGRKEGEREREGRKEGKREGGREGRRQCRKGGRDRKNKMTEFERIAQHIHVISQVITPCSFPTTEE